MSMGSTQPFRSAGTAHLAAGTSSANVPLVGGGEAVLIYNSSSAVAYVRFGTDATISASAADTPIPPGARMLMHLGGPFVTTAAAVLAAGSGTVFFTRGDGTVY
jgi:hypothetical protein